MPWEEASGARWWPQSSGTPGRRLPHGEAVPAGTFQAAAASGCSSFPKNRGEVLVFHPRGEVFLMHFPIIPISSDFPHRPQMTRWGQAAPRGRCWRCRWWPRGAKAGADIWDSGKESSPGGKGSGEGDSSASPACPRPEERAGEAWWKPQSREAGARALVSSVCKQRWVGDVPGTPFTTGSPWAHRWLVLGARVRRVHGGTGEALRRDRASSVRPWKSTHPPDHPSWRKTHEEGIKEKL